MQMFILLPIRVDNEFIADNYFHKKVPSTHLLCKSMDWFLYDRDLRRERAKHISLRYTQSLLY